MATPWRSVISASVSSESTRWRRHRRARTAQEGPTRAEGARRRTYATLIDNRTVACSPRDTDRYGRVVAICSIGSFDLGAVMVEAGWALDFPRYSRGRYAAIQREAEIAQRGMWAGWFQTPEDFRRDRNGRR